MSQENTSTEYDTITVGPNETFTKSISSGEAWENKIIDISASGAGYSIDAEGSDWTIRNIGVRGLWDSDRISSPFTVKVPDSSGSAVIENVYLPGAEDYQMGDPTGIYVFPEHAGTLDIRNVYIAQFGDNGIYGSPPGNPESHPVPGNHGAVNISDSFVRDCRVNVRVGTDSSVVENVVSVNPVGGKAAFRDYYGRGVTFRDCDAYAPDAQCFKSGSSSWNGDRNVVCGAGPTYENCRAEGGSILTGPCPHNGSPSSGPRTDPPNTVPRSAEEAARGTSGSSDQDASPPESDDGPYLHNAGGDSESSLIARTDRRVEEGKTYEIEFELGSGAAPDFGIAFGAKTSTWSQYSGYLLFFGSDETRIDRWDNGSQADAVSTAACPTGERLTAEIDYRDSGEALVATVSGASDEKYASLTLDDTTYDYGYPGFYQYNNETFRVYSYADADASTDSPDDGKENGDTTDGGVHPGTPLADDESVITISGTHLDGEDVQKTSYVLEVTDSLVPSTHNNATVDDNLDWSKGNTRVEHNVDDWKDAYVYTGEITTLTVDGPAKVFLNGDEIDPSNYGSTGGGSDDSGDGNSSAPPQDDGSGTDDTPSDGGQRPDFDDEWVENFIDSLFDDDDLFNTIFDSLFN